MKKEGAANGSSFCLWVLHPMQYLNMPAVISLNLTTVYLMIRSGFKFFLFLYSFLQIGFISSAQEKPIGYWTSFLPYNNAMGVVTDGGTLFTLARQGFFTFRPSDAAMDAFSKVEGMSDVGMQCIAYDDVNATAVLVYTNGNIDLFKNSTFFNVPDLKIKTVAGDKTVFQAYAVNGRAYLSSALGVIVIDVAKQHVAETYQFIESSQVIPVRSFVNAQDSLFYAVTSTGIYRGNRHNPALQNYQVWKKVVANGTLNGIVNANGGLFVSSPNSVYAFESDTLREIFNTVYTADTADTVLGIDAGNSSLFIRTYSKVTGITTIKNMVGGAITDAYWYYGLCAQVAQLADGTVWTADPVSGLVKPAANGEVVRANPSGPSDAVAFDVYAHDKNLYIAHGGYSEGFSANQNFDGVSYLSNNQWKFYKQSYHDAMMGIRDVIAVVKDESDGTLYFPSYFDGLVIIKADGSYEKLKENSIFDTSFSYYKEARQLIGLALDSRKNVWATSMYATHQLYGRNTQGQWYSFRLPGVSFGGPMLIDRNDQIWFASAKTNSGDPGGLTVFDPNGTVEDPTDDKYFHLTTGGGSGNLPDNAVLSLACDKNNNIWVGTANGIGIINHCTSPFTGSAPCDADRPIVQYDQFAGYLFDGNAVRAIAVDGANRKWVGTDDGVWLLSPDASKIVYRFTKDNSPMPSNTILKIAIDDVTGDVYIGTDQGLVSYRSTATEGGTTNNNVISFPNPVPSGYTGTIAIRGLAANSDVRITDIDGQLVFKTKALGGQAIWNGLDYTGHRPQSGVYMIFVSNSDGTQTYSGKLVFLQ